MLWKEEEDYEMFCQLAETHLVGKGRQIPSAPAELRSQRPSSVSFQVVGSSCNSSLLQLQADS